MARNVLEDIRKQVHGLVRGSFSPKNIKVSNTAGFTVRLMRGGKAVHTFWDDTPLDVLNKVREARL